MRFRRKIWMVLAATVMLGFGAVDCALSAGGEPDVHFVPTPQYVVNDMLEMASVNKNDIVYDLGCGDGRFVITAAAKYGAGGVGIDIDPVRIRESQQNAKRAGVADRVRFYEQDLYKTDISQATVVALYLLPELNVRLRPKLFRELKPGTRIVSHDFDMRDWKPDNTGALDESVYYLWIIPADVSGRWRLSSPAFGREGSYNIEISQVFQEIEATAVSRSKDWSVSDAGIKGDKISFLLTKQDNRSKVGMHFKGQVKGNSMTGTVQVEGGPFEGIQEWKATRGK